MWLHLEDSAYGLQEHRGTCVEPPGHLRDWVGRSWRTLGNTLRSWHLILKDREPCKRYLESAHSSPPGLSHHHLLSASRQRPLLCTSALAHCNRLVAPSGAIYFTKIQIVPFLRSKPSQSSPAHAEQKSQSLNGPEALGDVHTVPRCYSICLLSLSYSCSPAQQACSFPLFPH